MLDELRAPPGARPTDADLARACRTLRAVIHYDRRIEEWLTTWPERRRQPLTLHSDQRLPPTCDLGATMRRGGGSSAVKGVPGATS